MHPDDPLDDPPLLEEPPLEAPLEDVPSAEPLEQATTPTTVKVVMANHAALRIAELMPYL